MNLAWIHDPLLLIIAALAAFRLTRLWVDDMLPPLPAIRAAIRSWAFIRYDQAEADALEADRADPETIGTPRLNRWRTRATTNGGQPAVVYLVDCYWCAGFWISVGVFVAASLIPTVAWTLLAVPLALSAITGLIADRSE